MISDRALPNEDEKRENMEKAIRTLKKSGQFTPKEHVKNKIEEMISHPPVMHHIDDPVACAGRECLHCTGCPSFLAFMSELREINQLDADEVENDKAPDAPPLAAAKEANNEELKKAHAFHNELKKSSVKYSQWDMIKFMQRAVLFIMKIDLFAIKKKMAKFQKEIKEEDRVDINQEDWNIIRNFFILNEMQWWLDNMKAVGTKTDPSKFTLLLVEKQKHLYLPGKMLFVQALGTTEKFSTGETQTNVGAADLIESFDPKVAKKLKELQVNLSDQMKSLALWDVHFNK